MSYLIVLSRLLNSTRSALLEGARLLGRRGGERRFAQHRGRGDRRDACVDRVVITRKRTTFERHSRGDGRHRSSIRTALERYLLAVVQTVAREAKDVARHPLERILEEP